MEGKLTLIEHFSEIRDPRKDRAKLRLQGNIFVFGVSR